MWKNLLLIYVEGPTLDELLFDVANKVLYFLVIRRISGVDTGFQEKGGQGRKLRVQNFTTTPPN